MKKIFSPLFILFLSVNVFAQSGSIEFTSSGTFTVPDNVYSVTMEVIGAGGSGGGNGTGGGGGGAYSSGVFAVTPGMVLNIFVGTGGTDEATGTTTVDGFLMATGGSNGVSVPNPEIGGGGNGGVPYGGNIANYFGGQGGGGYYTYFGGGGGGAAGPSGNGGDGGNTIAWIGICLTPGGDGGSGGGAPAGNGGKGAGFTDDFCVITDPAGPGENYGAGGGGGNGNGGLPGNGSNGFARISWCAVDVNTSLTDETITANLADAAYQWIDCGNGNAIMEGETNQSFTATVNGSYAVIVGDGICVDTSACVDITTIVVQEIQDVNYFMTYENPFTDQILIQNANGDEFYSLLNATGQIIWAGQFIEAQNFSSLSTGIYFLKVQNENVSGVLRLMKQ